MAESKQIKNHTPHGCKGLNTKTQISTSTASHGHTFESMESEISRETALPVGNANFEVNTRKAEDEINATPHDSQHRTESSCSNSLSANVPILLTPGKNSAYSDISDNVRSSNEHENLPTPHSGERMSLMNNEGLREGGNTWTPKCKYESLESSNAKVAEFDLNEDINENEMGDFIQPVIGNVLSHSVIRVVAKTGVLSGHPAIPLEFGGGLGWMGPAKTSAFGPVSVWRNSNREENQCCFSGIDLNVAAAAEDDIKGTILAGPPLNLQDSCHVISIKRAESPCIDLNRIYDAGDEINQPSGQAKLENSHLLDLDLNVNTSRKSDPMKSGYQDSNPISRDYVPVLSPMQHFASYGSLQPKFQFLSHTLPPQAYSYRGPLQIGMTPYLGYPQEHTFLPGLYNPDPAKTTLGNLSTSGSKVKESKQFLFLADKFPYGERLQKDDSVLSAKKRKETEGGLECFTGLATNQRFS